MESGQKKTFLPVPPGRFVSGPVTLPTISELEPSTRASILADFDQQAEKIRFHGTALNFNRFLGANQQEDR
jgi:hypothetical protein